MIAYFVFLLCYSCKSDQLIIEKEQEYYLTDQDKINLYGKQVAITSNNSNPNLTEYFEAHQQQLISEALSLQLGQNYNQIFLVENHDKEFIQMCFMFMNNIECLYRIHNYLLDDKLIVNRQINLSLSTNLTKCLDLINYNEGLYLLICLQDNYIKAEIINEKNVIFDSIKLNQENQFNIISLETMTISSETNLSISFDYSKNRILFYEIDSIESPIRIYLFLIINLIWIP